MAADRVVIIDYQMGNLRSVRQAIRTAGVDPVVTGDPERIATAEKLVLPGQGELGNAIREIDRLGLRNIIVDRVNAGTPLLGICVGLQLLFESGEEAPGLRGLGLLPGSVPRFPDRMRDPESGIHLKIPQMGWNSVSVRNPNALTGDISEASYFYFVHSYYAKPDNPSHVALETRYGEILYCSMAADESNGRRLYATQFHPEKSQRCGLKMLSRFLELK